jgi:hypothetical protein
MPAIEISRLRSKINLLVKLIDEPAQLMLELTRFYESYSDLTFQSGLFSVRAGDLPAYRTPVLLNRELENAFTRISKNTPQKTLPIIDLLAEKPQLEPRQLACTLLGILPSEYFEEVTRRISAWAITAGESEDLVWIFKLGTKRIRIESPETWLNLLKTWLESTDSKNRRIAVFGLTSMINDASLTSLPLIFKYLKPLLLESNQTTLPYLESILEKLIQKSEKETVFFIKQVLRQSQDPLLTRMIRRNLSLFSTDGQESLRSFMREL